MLDSKQRAHLLGLASKAPTLVHVGKNGLADTVLDQIDDILSRRELVKVGVLKNSGATSRDLAFEMADKLGAEVVHTIGSKIILYRYSHMEGVEHIKLN
ncbi:MAG: YhbY family RNA-binding protein [Clostridia bacterium]|nr:YhbY family RNA-binding protein [Clostridia bacterium]